MVVGSSSPKGLTRVGTRLGTGFCATIDSTAMNARAHFGFLLVLVFAAGTCASGKWFGGKKRGNQNPPAAVSVDSGVAGCKVDIDGDAAGTTGSDGTLRVKDVAPGDHYVHVLCPGQHDASYFISPQPHQQIDVDASAAATNSRQPEAAQLNPAASEMELRRMVSEADQLRSSGQFTEAVDLLRKATLLDPRNGDLHRELGITFLMFHEWERARVEMLEAVRREPDNVDAHSGLAYALEKLGDLDAALKEYRLCTQLDPHDTSYRDHYVQVLGELYSEKAHKNR